MNIYDVYYNHSISEDYAIGMESCSNLLNQIYPPSSMLSLDEYEEAIESLTSYRDDELSDEEFDYAMETIFGPDLTDEELDQYLAEEGIFRSIGNVIAKAGDKVSDRYNKKYGAIANSKRRNADYVESTINDVIDRRRNSNTIDDETERKQRAFIEKAKKEADEAEKKYNTGSKVGNFLTKLSYKTKRADKKLNKLKKKITFQETRDRKRKEEEAKAREEEKKAKEEAKKEEHNRRRALKKSVEEFLEIDKDLINEQRRRERKGTARQIANEYKKKGVRVGNSFNELHLRQLQDQINERERNEAARKKNTKDRVDRRKRGERIDRYKKDWNI